MIDQIEVELARLGLSQREVHVRMTGCPNGCARPYNCDIGLVGKARGKYTVLSRRPAARRSAQLHLQGHDARGRSRRRRSLPCLPISSRPASRAKRWAISASARDRPTWPPGPKGRRRPMPRWRAWQVRPFQSELPENGSSIAARGTGYTGRTVLFRTTSVMQILQFFACRANLQFAFPVLQFAIGAAIDCKLRSSNCKVQIVTVVAAEPR